MSRLSKDRRPVCGKNSILEYDIFYGGCFQANTTASVSSSISALIYQNVTKILSASVVVDPVDLPTVLPPEDVDVVPTDIQVTSGLYTNSYVSTSINLNLPSCSQVIGHKRVVASKKWQGREPFYHNDLAYPNRMGWCCQCREIDERTSGNTTKYLDMSGNGRHYTENASYSALTLAEATASISRYSGQLNTNCVSSSTDPVIPDVLSAALMAELKDWGDTDATKIVDIYCGYIQTYPPGTVSGDGNSWTLDYTGSNGTILAVTVNLAGKTVNVDGYGWRNGAQTIWGQTSHVEAQYSTTTVHFFQWTEISGADAPDRSYDEKEFNVSLSTPYTSIECRDDVLNLLGEWELGDDIALPWREDEDMTAGVLVNYNEDTNAVLTFDCSNVPDASFDGSVLGKPLPHGYDRFWDAKHENWEVVNEFGCLTKEITSYGAWTSTGTQWTNKWIESQIPDGAFLGSNFMVTTPSDCTGGETQIVDDIMWAAKVAEIIIDKPSFNYFRPCGVDRLQIELNSNRCVTSASFEDGTIVIEALNGAAPTASFQADDYVWICGLGSFDGAWLVDSVSGDGYTCSLNVNQKASASQFATAPFSECGTGVISKMKWYGMSGICGRVDIASVTPTDPVTCSLAEPAYLIGGDLVVITGSKGMALDGFWTIQQVLDSTHVIIDTSGIGQAYTASTGQMYSAFSPDWKYNDQGVKGEYVTKTFTNEFRLLGEYTRLQAQYTQSQIDVDCGQYFDPINLVSCSATTVSPFPRAAQVNCGMQQEIFVNTCTTECLPFSACSMRVSYWSPNSESIMQSKYANSKNHGFGSVSIDKYGSMWNGITVQYMHDPLWQAPPCPCDTDEDDGSKTCNNCLWTEDDGTCEADVEEPCQKFYAMRPQVEPRCSVPDGAPTFVESMIGCKLTSNPCADKPVCNRPDNTGHYDYEAFAVTLYQQPYHSIYRLKQSCVCTSGSFANEYLQQLITCGEEEI